MSRPVQAALACAALLLGGCDDPEVELSPGAVAVLSGQRTVVTVTSRLGCEDAGVVTVTLGGESPAPVIAVEVFETGGSGGGTYYIGNPGQGTPFDATYLPGQPPPPGVPADEGRTLSVGGPSRPEAHGLRLEAGADTAPGEYTLLVEARGCGTRASAVLPVTVLGRVDLGGFCGTTSGEGCADDAGCERAGCGERCAPAGTRAREERREALLAALSESGAVYRLCPGSPCADPVPTGAICGCTRGACAWRPP